MVPFPLSVVFLIRTPSLVMADTEIWTERFFIWIWVLPLKIIVFYCKIAQELCTNAHLRALSRLRWLRLGGRYRTESFQHCYRTCIACWAQKRTRSIERLGAISERCSTNRISLPDHRRLDPLRCKDGIWILFSRDDLDLLKYQSGDPLK